MSTTSEWSRGGKYLQLTDGWRERNLQRARKEQWQGTGGQLEDHVARERAADEL